jgi:hypothetical protein
MNYIQDLLAQQKALLRANQILDRKISEIKYASGICQADGCLSQVAAPNTDYCEACHKENEEMHSQYMRIFQDLEDK